MRRVLQHFAFCDPRDLVRTVGSPQQHSSEAEIWARSSPECRPTFRPAAE